MNKFYMNGKLIHKAFDHNTKRCEVEKYEQHRSTHLNELRLCCPIEIYQHIEGYPRDN